MESDLPVRSPKKDGQNAANSMELEEVTEYSNPDWWEQTVRENNLEAIQRAVTDKPSGLLWQDKYGRTLLHVASKSNSVVIIQFLGALDFDLDAQDEQGQTALHEAIEFEKIEAIDTLVKTGGKVTLANNAGLCALLYAVELNRVSSLNALLNHREKVDPNITDESGSTALHYAAAKNYVECINTLLRHGASPDRRNTAGLYVGNVAAYAGAADALRALWSYRRELLEGADIEKFVNSSDSEGNLVLHAAVDSGSLETVKFCLEMNAHIDAQQFDLSTPVHFAALRGELKIIQAMFDAQPERKVRVLSLTDINGMTVLHTSVLFDNVAVAEFFIEQGAQIDVADINYQTPLLLAASKRSRNCLRLLIHSGAKIDYVDKDGRNFVHLTVLSGATLDTLTAEEAQLGKNITYKLCSYTKARLRLPLHYSGNIIYFLGGKAVTDCLSRFLRRFRSINSIINLDNLFNQKDYFGCTPLHYASIEGRLSAAENLLKFGARLQVQTHSKATALHFAAKYGRYNTCKKLLDSAESAHIINSADSSGMTALHFAAQNGHAKIVELLLERGAMFHRTYCGNTAFSVAAQGGHIKTMKILLTVNRHLLDLGCKAGNTALHLAGLNGHWQATELLLSEGAEIRTNSSGFTFFDLALKNGCKDVCGTAMKHDRWREVLSAVSPVYPSPIFGLIEEFPDICIFVLERCVTNNNKPTRSIKYAVTYDFAFLELSRPSLRQEAHKAGPALDWQSLDRANTSGNKASMETQAPPEDSTDERFKPTKCNFEDRFKSVRNGSLPVIKHMGKFGRVDLLVSPLCTAYMDMKWKRYGRSRILSSIISHIIGVILLAITIALSSNPLKCYLLINNNCNSSKNASCAKDYLNSDLCVVPTAFVVCEFLLVGFAAFRVPSLLVYAISMKLDFIFDINNILIPLVVVSLLVFTIPSFFAPGWIIENGFQWDMLAIGTAAEYFAFILELRIQGTLGLYVVMFVEILKTLFKCLLTFVCLLIGFALAFTVLFQVPIEEPSDYANYIGALAYENPLTSFMRVVVMFTGELEFQDTLVGGLTNPDRSKGLPFPGTTCAVFMAFVFLVTIALFNLVVGLAIGDIKFVRSYATLRRISMQADFYAMMEDNLYHNRWLLWIAEDPRPQSITVYPNARKRRFKSFFHDLFFATTSTNASKALDQAVESANKVYFHQSLKKQMKKEKERLKDVSFALEKQLKLTGLILEKMDVKWDCASQHDEGIHSRKFDKDFKPLKSNSKANWQKLYSTLEKRDRTDWAFFDVSRQADRNRDNLMQSGRLQSRWNWVRSNFKPFVLQNERSDSVNLNS